ncbi:hypothetical protein BEL05_08490 [Shewanella colwelliana]|uniref:Uncharacterized protein n=1 Tax=Shewanella colwelliana TaxID=23 RepID=A0A1E5IY19_SHECO|nr:hypothetical protein BEL05_08490 [Shewanella colwelliana]
MKVVVNLKMLCSIAIKGLTIQAENIDNFYGDTSSNKVYLDVGIVGIIVQWNAFLGALRQNGYQQQGIVILQKLRTKLHDT